jgi:PIN domain nuclease of toxin-antitoxin system
MRNKLLLDTSYLLPILGIEIKGIQEAFEKIEKNYEKEKEKLYFTRISLFEALGKISKIAFDEKRVQQGLQAILESEIIIEVITPVEAYLSAMKLKKKGFKDFIDLLLFETARTNKMQMLTRDKTLLQFITDNTKEKKWILTEKEFLEK